MKSRVRSGLPVYNHLNTNVPLEEWTEVQKDILLSNDTAGNIETYLDVMSDLGWHAELKTPFVHGELAWAGFTRHGTTGWNGTPDHQVGDSSLLLATIKATRLVLLSYLKQDEADDRGRD